jgi:hypothetical protein
MFRIDILRQLVPASVSLKLLGQFENRHGSFRGLWFLGFFDGVLIPNFNRVVERELIVAVLQLEDIFSVVYTNLRTWQ